MKTAEEILKEHGVSIDHDGHDYMKYGCTLNKIKAAMEEYACQSSSISDEEIETQAKIVFPFEKVTSTDTNRDAYNFPKQNGFCVGAKWARDRQKGGKP